MVAIYIHSTESLGERPEAISVISAALLLGTTHGLLGPLQRKAAEVLRAEVFRAEVFRAAGQEKFAFEADIGYHLATGERLWAEALNLGSWDVLIKPFDGAEGRAS